MDISAHLRPVTERQPTSRGIPDFYFTNFKKSTLGKCDFHFLCCATGLMADHRVGPLPWNVTACSVGVPSWVVAELSLHCGNGYPHCEKARDATKRCATHQAADVPSHPPGYKASALALQVMRCDEISPVEFSDRFTRRGLPVIIERAPELIVASQKELITSAARQASICGDEGCDVRSCDDESCQHAATMRKHGVPRCIGAAAGATPNLFSGVTGGVFGGTTHFDLTCHQSLSVQYEGTKRWTLWSPWSLFAPDGTLLPPHQRFEGILMPGDALWFPPAWFHTTEILDGPSTAAVYAVSGEPIYDVVPTVERRLPWALSPFGYGECRWRDVAWREEQRLQSKRVSDSVSAEEEGATLSLSPGQQGTEQGGQCDESVI